MRVRLEDQWRKEVEMVRISILVWIIYKHNSLIRNRDCVTGIFSLEPVFRNDCRARTRLELSLTSIGSECECRIRTTFRLSFGMTKHLCMKRGTAPCESQILGVAASLLGVIEFIPSYRVLTDKIEE